MILFPFGTRVSIKRPYRQGYWYMFPIGVVSGSMPSKYHEGKTVVAVVNDQGGMKKWFDSEQLEIVDEKSLTEDDTCTALARAVLSGDKIAARALADRVIELLG